MGINNFENLVSEKADYISRKVFTSEEVYQQELATIFANNWLYLCHESQLKNSGDFLSTYMGETPVIVALGEDGEIHVSINSCSHRGLPVCRSDWGNAKRFVCPYHAWSYDVTGELKAMPQERFLESVPDKKGLGLTKVKRVDSYRGLIFASFNEDIESLDDYLGEQKFYLDTFFNRFPKGVEVVGQPHKWLLDANWKLPVENQLGDVAHGPLLHSSVLAKDHPSVLEINEYGYNCVAKPGHGAALRLMPENEQATWGLEGMAAVFADDAFNEYLANVQASAAQRIGETAARIKGLTFGVYPNFNFLWANATIRVSHPKGPGKVEYWSWWVVPKDASGAVKEQLRTNFNMQFGPAGMLEEEDAEAWMQQYKGSKISQENNKPYYYGLGLGEEYQHDELPGMVGSCYNEHYARQFYLRWLQDIQSLSEV